MDALNMAKNKTYKLDKSQIKTLIDQSRTDKTVCPTAKKLIDNIDEEYEDKDNEGLEKDIDKVLSYHRIISKITKFFK